MKLCARDVIRLRCGSRLCQMIYDILQCNLSSIRLYILTFSFSSCQEMKSMLYQAVEEAPAVESVEEDILKRHFANFDETFFNYCDKELKKINT